MESIYLSIYPSIRPSIHWILLTKPLKRQQLSSFGHIHYRTVFTYTAVSSHLYPSLSLFNENMAFCRSLLRSPLLQGVWKYKKHVMKDATNFQKGTEVSGLWQLIIIPDYVEDAISVSVMEFLHNVGMLLDFNIKTKWQIWFLMTKLQLVRSI